MTKKSNNKMNNTNKKSLSVEEKYKLYEASVQNSPADIEFLNKEYKRIFKKSATTLREDFGGTAQLTCLWAKQSKKHIGYAIDLDPEPVAYGKKHHLSKLSSSEQKRVHYIMGNVLEKQDFSTDIVAAFNFSYFIFKERQTMLKYFKRVYKSLNKNGAFFLDIFGGTESYDTLVEETDHGSHSYFWDCDKYNPITNECLYYIHFKTKDGKKHEEVFTYDWRMWSIQEIVELLQEAGFDEVKTYWEEDEEDSDEGSGVFYESKDEENCESWVTYIVGLKK